MTADIPLYVPMPCTMPRKALLALAEAPDGVLANAPLLEAIGQPPDYRSLFTVMSTAISNGIVERTDDIPKRWRITDLGRRAVDAIKAEGAAAEAAAPACKPTRPTPANPSAKKAAPARTEAASAPEERTESPPFEFALTSSGRLLIEVDGAKLALSIEATDALFSYLDEQRGVVWEAA